MTDLSRRSFLSGLVAAPVVIRTPGLLMPVRSITPTYVILPYFGLHPSTEFEEDCRYLGRTLAEELYRRASRPSAFPLLMEGLRESERQHIAAGSPRVLESIRAD